MGRTARWDSHEELGFAAFFSARAAESVLLIDANYSYFLLLNLYAMN